MRQSKPHLPHGPLIYIRVLLALCKIIAGRVHMVNTALRGLFKEAYRRVPCGMRVLYLRTAFACLPEKLRHTACNGLIRPGRVATRMVDRRVAHQTKKNGCVFLGAITERPLRNDVIPCDLTGKLFDSPII